MAVIGIFSGKHAFLSNFFPSPFKPGGVAYPTVEHYYQSRKTLDNQERRRVVRASTPTKAKQLGQSVVIRRDWEAIKLQVMRDAIRFKFPTIHHELSELLLATGDAMLIEGNAWDDRYWGAIYNLETDKWTGYNWLGHLLMARRAELRSRVE